jgi:flagellar biosynthetic protein FlhB
VAGDDSDKTEDPTSKRLSTAREEGQVVQSQEIKIWAGLVACLVMVSMISPMMGRDVMAMMLPFIDHPHAFDMSREGLGELMTTAVVGVIKLLSIPLAVMLVFGLAATISQVGLLFVPKHLMPDLNKINPATGIKRTFSLRNLVEFLKSVAKIAIVGTVIYLVLRARIDDIIGLAAVDVMAGMDYLRSQTVRLIFIAVLMVTVLAAADWFYQRWNFMQQMRMTKQEVKDEHKQAEGDPLIKGRLRSLRMQRARTRMMASVPKASVVVTNPTHFACALKYDVESMGAPVLVAKGADLVAFRIRELADEHEVPIVENPPLARALFASVEIDQEIPPEHYKAVAEVIGYVMKLKGRLGG